MAPITGKIEGCFEGFLRVFHRSFKKVSRVFHESFMEEEVSRVLPECFKEVSMKSSRCFKKVSYYMALIAVSRAEGGLVYLVLVLTC